MFKKIKTKINWDFLKKCNVAFCISIAILWIGALLLNNFSSYQILKRDELTGKIQNFEDDLHFLNTQVSELQATQRIETESVRLELVKVDSQNIHYLDIE